MKDLPSLRIASLWQCARFCFLLMMIAMLHTQNAMASDFLSDVKAATEKNRSPNIDISDIALKHFPLGSEQAPILKQLETMGFRCYTQKSQSDAPKAIDVRNCLLDMDKWYQFGFGNQLRLSIAFKDGKITDIKGRLVYKSL